MFGMFHYKSEFWDKQENEKWCIKYQNLNFDYIGISNIDKILGCYGIKLNRKINRKKEWNFGVFYFNISRKVKDCILVTSI